MGIGTAMVIAPLLYAKEKGYELGVLQASQAGEPVYRKIGFEEYCRFVVYKYQDE
jgi:predicted acetyltransferase